MLFAIRFDATGMPRETILRYVSVLRARVVADVVSQARIAM